MNDMTQLLHFMENTLKLQIRAGAESGQGSSDAVQRDQLIGLLL